MLPLSPPKNILVADPDRIRCLKTAHLLKRLEYNSFVAINIHDLLLITNGVMPNLILLDIRMPFLEGQTCLERIKSDHKLSIIKVIMTAEKNDEKSLETIGKGADGRIMRPVMPTGLYREIHRLIEPHPREIPRLRVLFKVVVASGSFTKAYFATMLSEKGVFIRTLNALPVGENVRLSLDLPSAKPVAFEGNVIYGIKKTTEEISEPGMGIRFINIDPDMQMKLRRFIEDQLTGEIETDGFI